MERCPNCGASIRAGARFCTACGYRLIQPDAPTPTPSATPVASQTADTVGTTGPSGQNNVGHTPGTGTGTGTGASPAGPSNGADGDTDEASTTYADDFPASVDSDDPTSEPAVTSPAEPALAGNSPESSSEPSAGSSSVGFWDAARGMADEPAGTDAAGDDERSRAENTGDTAQTGSDSDDPIGSMATDEREPAVSGEAEPSRASGAAPHPRCSAAGTGIELSAVPLPAATNDGVWTASDSATPTSETGAVADDVVIESTVVRESSWPEAEGATSTGSEAEATARSNDAVELSFPDVVASPAEDDGAGTDAGTDVDWEPWGDGGADHAAGSTGSMDEATGQHAVPTSNATSTPVDGVERARQLLEELRATLDALPSTAEPAADPEATVAAGMVQQVEQLLDAWSGAGIDTERLEDLQRLAEDLEGRDYDIRALQRFSQERNLIQDLARGFEQQQDLIRQIRGVLNRTD